MEKADKYANQLFSRIIIPGEFAKTIETTIISSFSSLIPRTNRNAEAVGFASKKGGIVLWAQEIHQKLSKIQGAASEKLWCFGVCRGLEAGNTPGVHFDILVGKFVRYIEHYWIVLYELQVC